MSNIQRFKIGYSSDEWGQRSSTPSGIPYADGQWVRFVDHVAAVAALSQQGEPVAWHNPVATAVRDSMTGQVQIEYIGHFPADELVRLYAAPQAHHIDLVNVAVAVRDACHRAWVTSAENWRADVDVRQIVRDTAPQPAQQPLSDEQIKTIAESTKTAEPGRDGYILPYSFARAIEAAIAAQKGTT